MFQWYSHTQALNALGVMGMNKRNVSYISRYNARRLFPIVDDKLKTKELAVEFNVEVPKLLGVVDSQHDVNTIAQVLSAFNGFCIKPAKGSGGKGILVIREVKDGQYIRASGEPIALHDVQRHISNILAGLFSLSGVTDIAIIESLIVSDRRLLRYSFEGVPDVRIIVFKGVPVMAMMRLACRESHGKANLHQGAIGVGLNMTNGSAVNAVQRDKPVIQHPDTGQRLTELQVPDWDALLEMACLCHDMTELGYLGVDLVLDDKAGPTLLELNARPGLSIQIANGAGLLPRLRMIEAIKFPGRLTLDERIQFARENFGSI